MEEAGGLIIRAGFIFIGPAPLNGLLPGKGPLLYLLLFFFS